MTTTIRKAADYRRMPWRNGGGETAEIAIYPEHAGIADFEWRVSMATVTSGGPFSSFPGVDRTLAILSGQGIELELDAGGPQPVTPKSAPLSFMGETPAYCRLLGGAVMDLNIMTRRDAFSHRLTRCHLGCQLPRCPKDGWCVLIALGELELNVNSKREQLERLDALICDSAETEIAVETFGLFYSIEISPAPSIQKRR